ncbi:MAG: hypothetical protein ACU843_18730, partial [Gammaproteobacteria bacterium]
MNGLSFYLMELGESLDDSGGFFRQWRMTIECVGVKTIFPLPMTPNKQLKPFWGERVELKRHGRLNAAASPVDRCDRGISDTGVGARRAVR